MATTSSENVLYKYRFNDIQLIRGEEVLHLSWTNIASFIVFKNYDEYIRPQYVLNLQLDNKTMLWIGRYQNDFLVYLDIYKVMVNDQGEQVGPTSQFIRGSFVAVNPTSSSLSIERLSSSDPTVMDNDSVNDLTEMSTDTVSIGLLQREMYNASTAPCNMAVEEDNLQNIVGAMFTRAGFRKVLMSPFQNATVYKDLLVPALPLFRGIQYLDFKYGFHKAGTIVFYDYDTVYVIDSAMKLPTMARNEDPYMVLNIFEATRSILNGHVANINQCELFVSNSATSILSGENATNTVGSTTTTVDINTGEKSTITSETNNMYPLTSKSVVYGSSSPDFIQQRQIENKIRVNFGGYHYDISKFKPNTIVSIYHSNPTIQKQLFGKFRITSVMAEISNTGENFTANTSVALAYCGR